jgi:hypothetical protein
MTHQLHPGCVYVCACQAVSEEVEAHALEVLGAAVMTLSQESWKATCT